MDPRYVVWDLLGFFGILGPSRWKEWKEWEVWREKRGRMAPLCRRPAAPNDSNFQIFFFLNNLFRFFFSLSLSISLFEVIRPLKMNVSNDGLIVRSLPFVAEIGIELATLLHSFPTIKIFPFQ